MSIQAAGVGCQVSHALQQGLLVVDATGHEGVKEAAMLVKDA